MSALKKNEWKSHLNHKWDHVCKSLLYILDFTGETNAISSVIQKPNKLSFTLDLQVIQWKSSASLYKHKKHF